MKEFFLKTERIGFSVWQEDDIADALELWGNSAVTKFITAEGRMSEQQIKQRLDKEIETYNKYNIQYWPIYILESNENIGCCGLRPYDVENNIVEMGVHLKEKFWGQGYAKEASLAVIRYAFETLGANAIFVGHNPKNTSSSGLIKKLDFTYTRDEFYAPTGLMHPSYLMTKEEYMQIDN